MFTVKRTIEKKTVIDLLVCAFEGGSNYWYSQLDPLDRTSTAKSAPDRFYNDLVDHGFELVDKETGKKHTVFPLDFEAGLNLMSQNYAQHFGDVLAENTDATTGDVFLQLLVFKDVIYG